MDRNEIIGRARRKGHKYVPKLIFDQQAWFDNDNEANQICKWHRNLRAVLMAMHFDYRKEYILSESTEQFGKRLREFVIHHPISYFSSERISYSAIIKPPLTS